jgi:membrane peptidoglycan carboxypeptidase
MTADERHERTLRRKLREAWLAWQLERHYSKDDLLALYLNTTYYGHFAVGIEAAAQSYFGASARSLDTAQCALLAGLPQYPSGYNPIENPKAAKARQRVVLELMAANGFLTPKQVEEAGGESLAFAATPFPIEAPHFVMWAQGELETRLDGATLRRGGLRVVTTLDLDRQHEAEAAVLRRLAQLRPCAAGAEPPTCDPAADPSRRVENAALVALAPESGAVLAMVGSPDFFDRRTNGAVNAAISLRQPGSAIKPLTYAAALDPVRARAAGREPWTAATLIADLRTTFPTDEGQPYVPLNYDRAEHGPVTARTALANSYNIPAVKALATIGVPALLDQAEVLGIPWRADGAPQPSDPNGQTRGLRYGLALTLGGGEVRLVDLTAAYAAFANGGHRVRPYGIQRVETLDGQVLWDASTDAALRPEAALDPRVAFLITDILSDRTARLPAFGENNPLTLDRPAAAKTGTTTDWRDNWTMGYTPELAAGVWVGNADNTPMLDVSGISGAAPIWRDFMRAALEDTPPTSFTTPEGLLRVEVCADSGQLPGPLPATAEDGVTACPHRRMEWFIAGTEPRQVDTAHLRVELDVRNGFRAGPETPAEFVATQTFWRLPPEYAGWARASGFSQPPQDVATMPARGISQGQWDGAALALVSPEPNRIYRMDPALPGEAQEAPISVRVDQALAATGAPVAVLLDGQPLGTVAGPDYTLWWELRPGTHTLQAVATASNGQRLTSDAVTIRVVD